MDEPSNYNIFIRNGMLYDKTFTWTINGDAVDLTDYTAQIDAVNRAIGSLLSLSTTLDENGNGIVLGGAAGTLELIIKSALSADFSWNQGRYAINLTDPSGEGVPFLVGNITVKQMFAGS